MVNAKLHIICGNCGQSLTDPKWGTWEYIPEDTDGTECFAPHTVYIHCKNCATIHNLGNYMNEERE